MKLLTNLFLCIPFCVLLIWVSSGCADDLINGGDDLFPVSAALADTRTDYDQWRAITSTDGSEVRVEEWNQGEGGAPPRRRRKRKRRPNPDGTRLNDERPRQRRPRPDHDEDDHWHGEAIPEEPDRRRPHHRKPHNEDTQIQIQEEVISTSQQSYERRPEEENQNRNRGNDKSYRKPFSQAKLEQEDANLQGGPGDLKTILKQSGGLSLSELLQQRNLSLADLLKGKQNALSALTETTVAPYLENERKYQRRIPTVRKENQPESEILQDNSKEQRVSSHYTVIDDTEVVSETDLNDRATKQQLWKPDLESNPVQKRRRLPPSSGRINQGEKRLSVTEDTSEIIETNVKEVNNDKPQSWRPVEQSYRRRLPNLGTRKFNSSEEQARLPTIVKESETDIQPSVSFDLSNSNFNQETDKNRFPEPTIREVMPTEENTNIAADKPLLPSIHEVNLHEVGSTSKPAEAELLEEALPTRRLPAIHDSKTIWRPDLDNRRKLPISEDSNQRLSPKFEFPDRKRRPPNFRNDTESTERSSQAIRRRLPSKYGRISPTVLPSTEESVSTTTGHDLVTFSNFNITDFIKPTSTEIPLVEVLSTEESKEQIISNEAPTGRINSIKQRLSLKSRLRLPTVKIPKVIPTESINVNTVSSENYPVKVIIPDDAIPIDIETLFNISGISNFGKLNKEEETTKSEAKLIAGIGEHSGDLDSSTITPNLIPEASNRYENTENPKMQVQTTEGDIIYTNPSIFAEISTLKPKDHDKDDILELLGNRRGGARLAKILASRNMTLEELLEHRERGSSQRHLAEIFNNRTQETSQEPPKIKTSSYDVVTAFENFPNFNLKNVKSIKPDDIKTDSDGASYFTSVINIKPTDEVISDNIHSGRSLEILPISPKIEEKVKTYTLPTWKSVSYPNNYNPFDRNESPGRGLIASRIPKPIVKASDGVILLDDLNREDILDNSVAETSNELLDIDLSGQSIYKRNTFEDEDNHLPIGVRSAIIASSVIVGISLVLFLAIFVVCRWRQKRSNKLRYQSSFSASRGRIPILTRESMSKRGISPVMFSAGPRNSKVNTMDHNDQNVQDYLWDTLRKPFQ